MRSLPEIKAMNLIETYEGVQITYHESSDKWCFTHNGREQSAQSLKAAKAAIDTPLKKPFKRIKAWLIWHDDPEECEVTSIAIPDRYETVPHCWIVLKAGERRKYSAGRLAPRSAHNDEVIKRIVALNQEIEALVKRREALAAKLKYLEL